jgi:hypothetical protein
VGGCGYQLQINVPAAGTAADQMHLSVRRYVSKDAGMRQFDEIRIQERDMAEDSKSGGTNFLYFIVGGIVVVVALLAFLYMGGHLPGQSSKVSITVEAPKVSP